MSRIWTPGQVKNLAQTGTASWYQIRNQGTGPAEVSIYDAIGEWGVSARDFLHDLSQISGPIDLHLNSEGGEVFDGLAIYDALRRRGNVTVYVDSLAASISSVIAQAGVRRVMARNATMMIHDASSVAMGNAGDMRTMADLLDKTSDNLASVYAERSGAGDVASWRAEMQATRWYSAEEAVAVGLADEVAPATRTAEPVTAKAEPVPVPVPVAAETVPVPVAAETVPVPVPVPVAGGLPFRLVAEHGPELAGSIRPGSAVEPVPVVASVPSGTTQEDRSQTSASIDTAAITAALRSLKETE